MSNSQEKTNSLEQPISIEVSQSAAKQIERLNEDIESAVELSPRDIEARTEKARAEAIENASSAEIKSKDSEKENNARTPFRNNKISKKILNDSYRNTLKQTQDEMPINDRLFSKITHNPVVEKTSEFLGSTIVRPNAMLAGAFFAFILTLATYTISKKIGYSLSGFETMASFAFGWVVGILYDYLRVLLTGKKD